MRRSSQRSWQPSWQTAFQHFSTLPFCSALELQELMKRMELGSQWADLSSQTISWKTKQDVLAHEAHFPHGYHPAAKVVIFGGKKVFREENQR